MNYFTEDVIPDWWDGRVYERTIPGKPDWRELLKRLPCGDGYVEVGHESDGATVMFMRHVPFFGFSKHKHPIATRRHDKRCEQAAKYKKIAKTFPYFSKERKSNMETYKRLRAFADRRFRIDTGVDGTKWEQTKGFVGVRIGAFF